MRGCAVTKQRPLDVPSDPSLLNSFLDRFGVVRMGDPAADVAAIARAFATIPYENLTKVLSHAHRPADPIRTPAMVLADHDRFGAGGTCFSLTATLLALVRSLGLRAEPILADRPYGERTHSALLVWIDDIPHLVDPGFLLTQPMDLRSRQTIEQGTSFNDIILTPGDGDRWNLATLQQGKKTHRLTFRTTPADAGEFVTAWRDSFEFDMMHYPLLTKVVGDRQLYLQGRRLQVRTKEIVQTRALSEDEWERAISELFGLDPTLTREALRVWHEQGDLDG
jgi:arylamine N-acetyltransferase